MSLHVKGRQYFIDGERVPSVTTLIGDGLPKPALTKWAARTVANLAVDEWDELAGMPISERLKRLEAAPWTDRDRAAVRGTEVHKLAERLVAGEEVDVPDALHGHVDACVKFLDDWNVQPVVVERPVFSRRWRYGGRPDLFATLGDGRRLLIDWKTNRSGPFGDTAFQLAGYRYAEVYLDGRNQEQPIPEVDACAVIWLRADGYDAYPYEAGPEVHRQFLYIAATARAAEAARDYRGAAWNPPERISA